VKTETVAAPVVTSIICCDVCSTPVIRIPGEFDYIDPAGIITARCERHA
jgi:hypothetical protein